MSNEKYEVERIAKAIFICWRKYNDKIGDNSGPRNWDDLDEREKEFGYESAKAAILEMEKMEFNDRLDQEDLEECMNKDD